MNVPLSCIFSQPFSIARFKPAPYSAGEPLCSYKNGAVFVEEVLQGGWYYVTALAKFAGYIVRGIARPALRGVERDYPHRIVILTVEQVSDQRRSVGLRIVRLTPSPAERTEIIEHNIDIAIAFFGHNRR
jgi:hypothetical protein